MRITLCSLYIERISETLSAALEREKGEIADATAKLTQLENRKRAFAAQLDALRGELEEWSSKIQAIKEGKGI